MQTAGNRLNVAVDDPPGDPAWVIMPNSRQSAPGSASPTMATGKRSFTPAYDWPGIPSAGNRLNVAVDPLCRL